MKKQIVLLAAGLSSRFFPFQKSHKSMFTICGKPVIGWTLDGLQKMDIKEVVVIITPKDEVIRDYLENYKGLKLKIVYQQKSLGMGNAVLSIKKNLDDEFILGFPHFVNNKTFEVLLEGVGKSGGIRLLTELTDRPWEYGIIDMDRNGKPIGIVEKPKKGQEPSNIRLAGCYLLNKKFIDLLEKTPVSEYQFEIALNEYLKKEKVVLVEAKERVMSLKYPWDILLIKAYILNRLTVKREPGCEVSPPALIRGKVFIGANAKICDYSIIEGPAYIGKNAVVGNYSILRDNSVLEAGAQLERYVDCTRSIVGKNTHIHSGFVGDTIIGDSGRLGAGFVTGNKRMDRDYISADVKGNRVQSGLTRLGGMIGNDVTVGINVSVMPGIIIGSKSIIGPCSSVTRNIPENSFYYSEQKAKIKEIV